MSLNPRSIYIIAKKEFSDNARSKWIISLILIFLVLTIVSSIMAGSGKIGDMEDTVSALLSIASMLVPVISIMLGYATISGEVESGALSIVLASPIKRLEVLLGKLLGLGSVMCFSILVGFGVSGLIIAVTTGHAQWGSYLVFVLLTMLLGLLYLSLAICFSAILKRRVVSLAAGVMIFFMGMIVGMIFMGAYMATGGSFEDYLSGDTSSLPDWFWVEPFFGPQDGYGAAAMLAFGQTDLLGFEFALPPWLNIFTITMAQIIWTAVPLGLACILFQKRDM